MAPDLTDHHTQAREDAGPPLPLSGQQLGLGADGGHGERGLPGGRREAQIQGARLPVQRLQPQGPLHLALNGAGPGPAVDRQ